MKAIGLSFIAVLGVVSASCSDAVDAADTSVGTPPVEAASTPPAGHWYVAREPITTPQQRRQAESIAAIGYAPGSEGKHDITGVTLAEIDRMQPGLNLYSSGDGPHAFLMEQDGTVVHRWSVDVQALWPEKESAFGYFRKARLLSGDRLLAVFTNRGLVALDKDSNVLWTYDHAVHHDVCEMQDGTIITMGRMAHVIPDLHASRVLVDDRLVFLDPGGVVQSQVSLLDCLLRSEFADRTRQIVREEIQAGLEREAQLRKSYAERLLANPELEEKLDAVGDILHSNSVRVIGPDFAAKNDGFEEGWLLVSIRNIHALVAIEMDETRQTGTVRRFLTGDWRMQHEAVPLPSGAILMFDNRGSIRRNGQIRARVIEVDPGTSEIVWSVDSVDGRAFLSPVAGSCQRLRNGNTLVIESTGGTAYEFTRSGRCVWKFVSPHRAGDDGEFVALLPDVIRVDPATASSILE